MIRVERPEGPPKVLHTTGRRRTKDDCKMYDDHPCAYRDASRTFRFSDYIYGHASVRSALLWAQHNKCCYCECHLGVGSHEVVEHFRPRGAVQQVAGSKMLYPGYYWLAYRWDNLLMSCDKCNTKHKRALFPLVDDIRRARNHHDDIGAEQPLFVDPSREDPRQHIRFRGAAVVGVTKKGRATIEGMGLRRSGLEDDRRRVLADLEVFRSIVESEAKVERDLVERARKRIDEAVLPSGKYSSMARDFLDGDDDGEGG